MSHKSETHTNQLIHEKSPYLLQHAHNPVNWYPWNEAAFQKAREEGKPIFLSVGYSTCHWCHVMEEESFVNSAVAQVLNDCFISIKVDREERPDVDQIYMQAVTAMTGSGGWPMSVFLTPDLKPFYGGTYFPPEDRYGRPGFLTVLNAIRGKWETNRDHILKASTELTNALKEHSRRKDKAEFPLDAEIFDIAFQELDASFDREFGGFGNAPKFPRTHTLSFLLHYFKRTGNQKALQMTEQTLKQMSRGGMNDQLGGGFHRYSTDRVWQVPHFEKMLYDQAIMSKTYLEAFQVTRKESDAREARKIFDYVLRDLTASSGAFYSAEDADSLVSPESNQKSEGAFYIWSFDEIIYLLGKENGEIFNDYFGVKQEGNAAEDPQGEFKGKNILFRAHSINETAQKFGKTETETQKILNDSISLLMKARAKRPRPHLDDKTLTDWNGLMISSLAFGSRVLNDKRYQEAAQRAADFILSTLKRHDGRLMHRFRDEETAIPGFLEDYAFFIHGLLDLYEAVFDAHYLKEAHALSLEMIHLFWDEEEGGFLGRGKDTEELIAQSKELYDGAIPSGNSVATLCLLRLGKITGDQKILGAAHQNLKVFSTELTQYPSGFPQMLIALDFLLGPTKEIVIHGKRGQETEKMAHEISNHFLPRSVILFHSSDDSDAKTIEILAPFVSKQIPVQNKTTVFVCENYTCRLPVTDPSELKKLIEK